jgi:hypothetical protein
MLYVYTYNIHIYMFRFDYWCQDYWNQQLLNRDQSTYGSRPNYLYPTHLTSPPICHNINTHTHKCEIIEQSDKDLLNTKLETQLFTIDHYNHRDIVTPVESQSLKNGHHDSQTQLYQTYHANEIHSPCYPDMDRFVWDNTTKAIYQTVDKRLTLDDMRLPENP